MSPTTSPVGGLLVALLAAALGGVAAPSATSAGATCQGQAATHVGTPGESLLTGTVGDDVIASNGARRVGDDRVTVDNGAYRDLFAYLGDGADTFAGAGSAETVFVADTEASVATLGTDVVRTFGGDDTVFVGAAVGGPLEAPSVDTGRGNDTVWVTDDGISGDAVLDGGGGLDRLYAGTAGADVRIDTVADVVDENPGAMEEQTLVDGWTGFEVFGTSQAELDGPNGGTVTFAGSAADEVLTHTLGAKKIVAAMGGGNDTLRFGFVSVAGAYAGDRTCFGKLARIEGGPGNDLLLGSADADTLVGGPGFDRARGFRGDDACQAEVRMSC